MKARNIWLVLGHEYTARVKKKSFILTTLLTPILMGLLIVVPGLIMYFGGDGEQKIKVFDGTGVILPQLSGNEKVIFESPEEFETVDILKCVLGHTGLYALVEISPFDSLGNVSVKSYSVEPVNIEVKQILSEQIGKALETYRLASYNIPDIERILQDIKADITVETLTVAEDGSSKEESVEIYMILAYLMAFLIYMFIFLFGNMVMRSVIDEKSNRIVEVIISTVDSVDLMVGKIIGVALVALTQFTIWIVLLLAITSATSSLVMPDAGGMMATMTQSQLPAEAPGGLQNMLGSLFSLDWAFILGCFVIYFLLGYLLYASMFAAIGSAVDNEADTSQLILPVTIPLIIGLFIMLHTFEHPSSQLSFWASIIPWTSPMVMLARIPFGVVPFWQVAVSVAVLLVTFLATAWASAKIYRTGILLYGKKSTVRDLLKWVKQKD